MSGVLRAPPDQQRQHGKARRHEIFEHGAVGGDQRDHAVFLPEREGLALDDADA